MFEATTVSCEKLPHLFQGIIDPPTPFGPADEWRSFLEDISSLPDSLQIREFRVKALEALRRASRT
jgi:hypothetical protein